MGAVLPQGPGLLRTPRNQALDVRALGAVGEAAALSCPLQGYRSSCSGLGSSVFPHRVGQSTKKEGESK